MAQRPILDESSVALTFDDVLLAPRPPRCCRPRPTSARG